MQQREYMHVSLLIMGGNKLSSERIFRIVRNWAVETKEHDVMTILNGQWHHSSKIVNRDIVTVLICNVKINKYIFLL